MTQTDAYRSGYDKHMLNTPVELSKTRQLIGMVKDGHAEALPHVIDRLTRGNDNKNTIELFRELLQETMNKNIAKPPAQTTDAPAP